MTVDVILTTGPIDKLFDVKLARVRVSMRTNMLDLFKKLASKHFGPEHHVRRDRNLFGWVAVSKDGDTITLA